MNLPIEFTSTSQQSFSIKVALLVPLNLLKFVRNSFTVNGAFYAADIEFFKRKKTFITKNTLVHIMPKNRSLDIDTKEDFLLAKKIIKVKK